MEAYSNHGQFHLQLFRFGIFLGGWRLRWGRVPLSRGSGGLSGVSSGPAVSDDGGVRADECSVMSSVGRGSAATGIADARGTEVGSVAGSDLRGRFEGVEATRPSQRYDRFEVGVVAGAGPVVAGRIWASTRGQGLEGPGDSCSWCGQPPSR